MNEPEIQTKSKEGRRKIEKEEKEELGLKMGRKKRGVLYFLFNFVFKLILTLI